MPCIRDLIIRFIYYFLKVKKLREFLGILVRIRILGRQVLSWGVLIPIQYKLC